MKSSERSPAEFAASKTARAFAGSWVAAIRSSIALIIGSLALYSLSDSPETGEQVVNEIVIWALYIVVPAVVILAVVFLYQLWLAPFRMTKLVTSDLEGRVALLEERLARALEDINDLPKRQDFDTLTTALDEAKALAKSQAREARRETLRDLTEWKHNKFDPWTARCATKEEAQEFAKVMAENAEASVRQDIESKVQALTREVHGLITREGSRRA